MLVVYDKQSKEIISISAFEGDFISKEAIDSIDVETTENQGKFRVYDIEKIKKVLRAWKQKAKIWLIFAEDNTTPIDIETEDVEDRPEEPIEFYNPIEQRISDIELAIAAILGGAVK